MIPRATNWVEQLAQGEGEALRLVLIEDGVDLVDNFQSARQEAVNGEGFPHRSPSAARRT
jgi:hypothetical protein